MFHRKVIDVKFVEYVEITGLLIDVLQIHIPPTVCISVLYTSMIMSEIHAYCHGRHILFVCLSISRTLHLYN